MEKIRIIRYIDDMSFEDKVMLLYCIVDSNGINIKVDKKKVVPTLEKMVQTINGDTLVNLAKNKKVMFMASQIMEMNEKEQNMVAWYIYKQIIK
jgi:hypothetical protein